MQIANGLLICSPENQQRKIGYTPAEVLLNYHLHKAYANGTPLGDWYVQEGEAVTVDVEARAVVEASLNHLNQVVPGKDAVPAVTHPRTQIEEIDRLKKRYTGLIKGVPAFEAVFGAAAGVRLPETFAEIEPQVLIHFHKEPTDGQTIATKEVNTRKAELLGKLRHDVCEIAGVLGLSVHHEDTKESIINAIVSKEESEQNAAIESASANDGEDLSLKSKKELLELAASMGLEVKPADNKESIIEAIKKADESAA